MSMMIPSKAENPDGLHGRYRVTKADGSPTDPGAVYFVLRLDWGGSDHGHIAACREAARAYFRAAPPNMRQVAVELMVLVDALPRNFSPLCPSCQGTEGQHEPECPDDESVRP